MLANKYFRLKKNVGQKMFLAEKNLLAEIKIQLKFLFALVVRLVVRLERLAETRSLHNLRKRVFCDGTHRHTYRRTSRLVD